MAIARDLETPVYEAPAVKEVARETARSTEARLARIEPGSVFRVWLVFSVLGLAAFLVGVTILFAILGATGALSSAERLLNTAGIGHHFHFSLSWVLGHFALWGLVLVVLASTLAACVAMIYNAVAGTMGGIEVTLSSNERAERTSVARRFHIQRHHRAA